MFVVSVCSHALIQYTARALHGHFRPVFFCLATYHGGYCPVGRPLREEGQMIQAGVAYPLNRVLCTVVRQEALLGVRLFYGQLPWREAVTTMVFWSVPSFPCKSYPQRRHFRLCASILIKWI